MLIRIFSFVYLIFISFYSFANSKQLEIRVIDEFAMPVENAIFSILDKSRSHKVIQEQKTTDGTFHLTIDYDKEYYFMIQSQAFFVSHLFLSFHEIKNQSLEGDILNTQNTNVRILSKNTIAVTLKRIPYFQFLAKDQHTGEYIEAEYSIRLNKTGAVAIQKARKGEPIEYLPEMFCTFEVSVRKDNYLAYTQEFLYDNSFKGMERIFELKTDSTNIRKDLLAPTLVKQIAKPVPKIITPAPDLIIPFEQGSFYLTAKTQGQLNDLINQIQSTQNATIRIVGSHDGIGSTKLNSYLAYLRAIVIQIYLDNHSLKGVKTVIQTIVSPATDSSLAARRVAKIYIENPQDFISSK
jgi:hypothetical protein